MDDPYAALGLDHGARSEEIAAAYRRLVHRYPPELNPRRFARLRQAYEFLSSYERRMREAATDLDVAIDLLFPRVPAKLRDPPKTPELLEPADWAPFTGLLRERVVRAILADRLRQAPP